METPAIVAPVSRLIAVTDARRSIEFYRDVLGFQVASLREEGGRAVGADLSSGPARIELAVGDSAPDSTGERRPRGSAMLFFETNDLSAMREGFIARGGSPGDIERVNWIKMRMFEIRDPDGHLLWFAQSFQEPERDKDPLRQLRHILPELPLADVPAGVAHYRDVLGFRINYAEGNLGVMDRDDITLLLIGKSEQHKGIGSCYVYVRNADALHAELKAKGANVRGTPVSHPWGLRDFQVLDPEGNRITFGETFE